ncbi:MAG: hypothetical protein WCG27_02595 [Pseudomonadota bacterium]
MLIPWVGFSQPFVVPNDRPYSVWEDNINDMRFVYSDNDRSLIPAVSNYAQQVAQEYKQSFSWQLDHPQTIVLASPSNQIPNAFATVHLNNLNFFYDGGVEYFDQMAISSWTRTLLLHEGAHLYQMDPKQGLSKILHTVFGDSVSPHLFYILPISTTPNVFLPTWLLEGNSVLNESRFGNGGRLYSGEELALFYGLVKAGKLKEKRLTNSHLSFPFGHEKYNVGAYFALYLAEKYGIDKTNQYFYAQSEHFINPFIINSTFKNHFGLSYSDQIVDFLNANRPLAQKQKSTETAPFVSSVSYAPMSRSRANDRIYFLTNDEKSTPILWQVSSKDGSLKSQKADLMMGKVFEVKHGEFATALSDLTTETKILYSLWGERRKDFPQFRGKLVCDWQDGHLLWLDPKTSFALPELYLDNKKVGIAQSSGIIGADNQVYYFRQEGDQRTCFRNQTALFTYTGYYGKLVDIDVLGDVYFIASTSYGASLFKYQKGHFFRLSPADTIVDAKLIKGEKALVTEVDGHGYHYAIISLSPKEERPHIISYFFEKEDAYQLTKKYLQDQVHSSAAAPVPPLQNERDYGLRDIRFVGINTIATYAKDISYSLNGTLADPLAYNQIQVGVSQNKIFGTDTYRLSYLNAKYLLNWYLLGIHQVDYPTSESPYRKKDEESFAGIGFQLPFLHWSYWDGLVNTSIGEVWPRSYWRNYASIMLNYNHSYNLNFYPYRNFGLLLENQVDEHHVSTQAVSFNSSIGLGWETFFKVNALYKKTNDEELILHKPIDSTLPINSGEYSYFSSTRKTGGRLGAELSKAINTPLYFAAFPLSLRRMAPKLIANHFYYNSQRQSNHDFNEYGGGVDIETLLFHLAPLRIESVILKRDNRPTLWKITLGYSGSF